MNNNANDNSAPRENLSVFDSVTIVVGVVVGIGIFRTPSIVASVADSGAMLILFWCLGGLLSCIGALCYAELTSTYPHSGGDYYFLKKSFGDTFSFLFAWSRMTVIQSGSIAMIAFLIGDYASGIFSLGPGSNVIYAIATVTALTSVNIMGLRQGRKTQHVLVALIISGILTAIAFSVFLTHPEEYSLAGNVVPTAPALGTAMIFVLLTYGGWNEAAFISAEVRSKRKNMVKVLLYSISIITAVYLVVNVALLRGLGLVGMADSNAVVADLMEKAIGSTGAAVVTVLILISALSTINATIITGARTNYALGRDYPLLKFLGYWQSKKHTPRNALLAQGAIATALIIFGAGSRDGFVMMIEYTAPVFWFFFLMVGISLFVLRYRNPETQRSFSVPFYPITPVFFCLACVYMLYSSVMYTGIGAIIGIIVLLTGIPLLILQKHRN